MATAVQVESRTEHKHRPFDPDRLAYLEVAGLRAYYDHEWLLMLRLVLQLMHEQFGLSWLRSLQAAYYTTRASIAWAPKDNDPKMTWYYIRKFYKCAATHGKNLTFEPKSTGDLEYKYWVLHRRFSGRPFGEKAPYVRSLVELHSALFNLPEEAVYSSAVDRAHGTDAIDEVTGKRSTDIEADWEKAEMYLRSAYRSVVDQM